MKERDYPERPPLWPGVQLYTDSGRLFVRRSGRVGGTPLLLLHGWGVHGGMYQGMRARLERDFDLLVPDLRGHGYSSTPTGAHRWDIADYADDLIAVLDQLDLPRVHVAGYSMGGFVALALTQRAPDRVERLGVMCSAARHPPATQRHLIAAEAAFKLLPPSTMQVLSKRLLAGPGVPDDLRRVMGWLLGYNTRGGISGAARAMRRTDLRAGLSAIHHPTLLVTAEKDVAVPPWISRELLEGLPEVTHRHFDDAGHALVASHGPLLAEELVRFFGALKAP